MTNRFEPVKELEDRLFTEDDAHQHRVSGIAGRVLAKVLHEFGFVDKAKAMDEEAAVHDATAMSIETALKGIVPYSGTTTRIRHEEAVVIATRLEQDEVTRRAQELVIYGNTQERVNQLAKAIGILRREQARARRAIPFV